MGYVILIRNPSNDRVIAATEEIEGSDWDRIAVYMTEAEAEKAAHTIPVCRAWPYIVVEAP